MQSRLRNEKGQNLVELALVMTLLLIVLAGAIDVGRAFQNFIVVKNASREGARLAARSPCNTAVSAQRDALEAAILAATKSEADNSGVELQDDQIAIGGGIPGSCPSPGNALTVTVTYDDFSPILTDALGMDPFTISATTEMLFAGSDAQ